MNPQLAAVLIQTFGPLALSWIRGFYAGSNGQFPTEAQLADGMQAHADRFIAEGTAWLAAHPQA